MPRTSNPNQPSTAEGSVEHKTLGLTRRQQGGLLLAGITLFATLGSGCSAKSVDKAPVAPTSTGIEAAKKAAPSASEQTYANYVKTLTPEQAALRQSLNPDALAAMSDDQLAEAFTIHASEVATKTDSGIDPELYAEAFAARMQAMNNSGLSEKEYSKWGGVEKTGLDTIDKITGRYFPVESKALFGHVGTDDSAKISLTRGSSVDLIIDSGKPPMPQERFHFRVEVKPDTVKTTKASGDTMDIEFVMHVSDNWEEDTMKTLSGLSIESTDDDSTCRISGLHINKDGTVLPNELHLN